jgi:hypothetical protein
VLLPSRLHQVLDDNADALALAFDAASNALLKHESGFRADIGTLSVLKCGHRYVDRSAYGGQSIVHINQTRLRNESHDGRILAGSHSAPLGVLFGQAPVSVTAGAGAALPVKTIHRRPQF